MNIESRKGWATMDVFDFDMTLGSHNTLQSLDPRAG